MDWHQFLSPISSAHIAPLDPSDPLTSHCSSFKGQFKSKVIGPLMSTLFTIRSSPDADIFKTCLTDKSHKGLYFCYCQQLPQKDQNQQWIDPTDKYYLCIQSLIYLIYLLLWYRVPLLSKKLSHLTLKRVTPFYCCMLPTNALFPQTKQYRIIPVLFFKNI